MKRTLAQLGSLLTVVIWALFVVSSVGCGGERVRVQNSSAGSVGQQLQDLEKAYREGTINQKEYEKLKKAIIKRND